LRNIAEVFRVRDTDRLPSADLVDGLLAEGEWGWATWYKGHPLNQRSLAKVLRPFGIRSKQLWMTGQNVKGFERTEFVDAWLRYGAFYPLGGLDPKNGARLETKTHPLDESILADEKQGITPDKQSVLADLADKTPLAEEAIEL
jgi:hypothetical protein